MPRLALVEPCPQCRELALVSGVCRACGHLQPEALERCDDDLPVGAVPDEAGVCVQRRWIVGRGLLGALAAGPLAVGVLGVLVLARHDLPAAAAVLLALAVVTLLWIFVAMLANATTIEVRSRLLAVRHGPLPIPGVRDLTIAANEIEGLAMRQGGHGELTQRFVLEARCAGRARPLYASADREEIARLLRLLREALPPPRRSAR